jgi:glycosyltransferase involved in cell wall biosynthesis
MSHAPLRIAMLSPPWFSVPPSGYGGIEAVVALLTEGLVALGHDVTLFASGDSRTSAQLVAAFPEAPSVHIGETVFELRHAIECYRRAAGFDVIHDHSGVLALALGALTSTPVVHTVHGPMDGDAAGDYGHICALLPHARLISISLNQQRRRPELPWLANILNAVDLAGYALGLQKERYLAFLGRMSADKGCHLAIEIAAAAGMPLRIAGKRRERLELEYFAEHVAPHLGPDVVYLGEISHEAKVDLLRHAQATLFPITWDEPFGLVMIESMACGTPVLATRRGAVPEVVEHGVTGYVVDDPLELAGYVDAAAALDPATVRAQAEARFSAERLVADHVAAYRAAIAGKR